MWGGDPSADIIPSSSLALEDIIFYGIRPHIRIPIIHISHHTQ